MTLSTLIITAVIGAISGLAAAYLVQLAYDYINRSK